MLFRSLPGALVALSILGCGGDDNASMGTMSSTGTTSSTSAGTAATSGGSGGNGGNGGAMRDDAGTTGSGGGKSGGGGSGTGGASGSGGLGALDGAVGPSESGAKDAATAMGDASKDSAAREAGASAEGGSLVHPPAAGKGDVAAGLAQLNRYRASLGLSMVTLDAPSSTGCEGHLDYLIAEQATQGNGYLAHEESDHTNMYYSEANEKAGKDSDLAWGSPAQSLGQAVDLWINGLYHRHPLLDPGLVKVGAASKSGYNCLNYRATGNTVAQKLAAPTLWPADGMTDVPRAFGGNEGPCPTNADPLSGGQCAASGFIPTATFYNWGTYQKGAIESVASATLTDDASSTVVPLLVYFADKVSGHDPAPGYVQDEVALVPQASLAANKTFRVDISAVVKGAPTNLSWKFTTGSRSQ